MNFRPPTYTYNHEVINFPKTVEDALRVLKREAKMRMEPEYIEKLKVYIQSDQVPPDTIQEDLQYTALKEEGFSSNFLALDAYRKYVRQMSIEDRKDIWFLRVNDEMFK